MDAGADVQNDMTRRPDDAKFLVSEYLEESPDELLAPARPRGRARVRALVGTMALLAGCHAPAPDSLPVADADWSPFEQWALGAMSGALADEDECFVCHVGDASVDHDDLGREGLGGEALGQDDHISGLVLRDRLDDVAGAPVEGLGAGAICADCHRGDESPQAEVFLGRGSRLLGHAERALTHGRVADSCLACHAPAGAADATAIALGHTFETGHALAVGDEDALVSGACVHCHGELATERLGADERLDARAIAADLARVRAALDAAGGADTWPDAEHDLTMLERDASLGAHNPRFARAILDFVGASLAIH